MIDSNVMDDRRMAFVSSCQAVDREKRTEKSIE